MTEASLDEFYRKQEEALVRLGSDAKIAYSYIKNWIKEAKRECHKAFAELPLSAESKDYLTVKISLDSVMRLESSLLSAIAAGDAILGQSDEEEDEDDFLNI